MRRLKLLVLVLALASCSKGPDVEKELYGAVNGRTIRGQHIMGRLGLSEEDLLKADRAKKESYFHQVAEQIVMEDTAKVFGGSQERLFKFFEMMKGVAVSREEVQDFLKAHPELKGRPQAEIESAVKAHRQTRLDQRYRDELKKRSTVRFLLGEDKRAAILGLD